jgi:hypothetical protein
MADPREQLILGDVAALIARIEARHDAEAAISRSSSFVSAHELAAPAAPMASAVPRPSSTPQPPASIAKQLLLRAGAVEPLLEAVLQRLTEQDTEAFAPALQR